MDGPHPEPLAGCGGVPTRPGKEKNCRTNFFVFVSVEGEKGVLFYQFCLPEAMPLRFVVADAEACCLTAVILSDDWRMLVRDRFRAQ